MVTEGVQEMCEQTYRKLLEAKQQFTADIEEVCECPVHVCRGLRGCVYISASTVIGASLSKPYIYVKYSSFVCSYVYIYI